MGGKVIYFCIFRNNLLNIWTSLNNFFIELNDSLCDLKSLAARMLLGPGIYAASERTK